MTLNGAFLRIFFAGVLGGIIAISHSIADGLPADQTKAASAVQSHDIPTELAAVREKLSQRKALLDNFKSSLAAAKTSEEKQKAINDFRAQNQKLADVAPTTANASRQSAVDRPAAMKQKLQGNPDALQRLTKLESRLQKVERMKTTLKALNDASAEQRPQLEEELRKEREELAKDALETAQVPTASTNVSDRTATLRNLPPQMQAMVAKQEQRRQEIEALKESLKTAGVEERKKLIQAWQQKQQTEMASRAQEGVSK